MQLSEKAYQLIKHRIVTLQLPPLTLLSEREMMRDLNLGRTPIREALQRLANEGLVKIVPRRGIFVSEISITDLQNILEVRIKLEDLGARLVAQRITPAQMARIDSLLDEMKDAEGDRAALLSIDERFHELLYEAMDNEYLATTLRRLYALSLRLWYLALDRLDQAYLQDAIRQHRQIAQAIRQRDPARAGALLVQHVQDFQHQYRRVI